MNELLYYAKPRLNTLSINNEPKQQHKLERKRKYTH